MFLIKYTTKNQSKCIKTKYLYERNTVVCTLEMTLQNVKVVLQQQKWIIIDMEKFYCKVAI